MEDNILETEKIPKLFIKIVVPSMIAMVIIGIQGIVDGLFLGNFVGSLALASVNIAQPFLQATSAFSFIISVGATAFIGRLLGEKEPEDAQTVFKTALISSSIMSVSFMIIGFVFSTQIATMLGADAVLVADCARYIKIVSLSIPFMYTFILFSFVNRVCDRANLFLIGTLAGIFTNIVLNYILIVRFNLGITGAAIGTISSFVVSLLLNFKPVLDVKNQINIFVGKFNKIYLFKMMFNGASEGVTSISTAVTTLVLNLTFMHFYGAIGVSAYTIISYIAQVGTLTIFGMSDGACPIISVNFGAKKLDRVKEIVKFSVIINFCIGLVLFFIVRIFGQDLISMFAKGDENLVLMTYNGAKLYAFMFLICGANIFASAYFTAIGQAMKSMIISAFRGLIFIIIGVYLLPTLLGVTGVWLVAPFADFMAFLVVIIILKFNKKTI